MTDAPFTETHKRLIGSHGSLLRGSVVQKPDGHYVFRVEFPPRDLEIPSDLAEMAPKNTVLHLYVDLKLERLP